MTVKLKAKRPEKPADLVTEKWDTFLVCHEKKTAYLVKSVKGDKVSLKGNNKTPFEVKFSQIDWSKYVVVKRPS